MYIYRYRYTHTCIHTLGFISNGFRLVFFIRKYIVSILLNPSISWDAFKYNTKSFLYTGILVSSLFLGQVKEIQIILVLGM